MQLECVKGSLGLRLRLILRLKDTLRLKLTIKPRSAPMARLELRLKLWLRSRLVAVRGVFEAVEGQH